LNTPKYYPTIKKGSPDISRLPDNSYTI